MKTKKRNVLTAIFRLAMVSILLIAFSCSKEPLDDQATEDLEAVSLKSENNGEKCYKRAITRFSINKYVGINLENGNTEFSGFWSRPIGKYTGSGTTTSFTVNEDGTFTQTSDDVVIAANGDEMYTSSTVLIIPTSETEGNYTAEFDVTGGTGKFDGATGHFRIRNGKYDAAGSTHNAIGRITYFKCKRHHHHHNRYCGH